MKIIKSIIIPVTIFFSLNIYCVSYKEANARIDLDAVSGKPLIAHIVVALCDNESQGIVPVNKSLGNGNSPRTNLYWGAMFGVKTFFSKHKNWQKLTTIKPNKKEILERVIFKRGLIRNGKSVVAYVVADAWQGREIKSAIEKFMEISSGEDREIIKLGEGENAFEIVAGGGSHVTAYIGHNGLMDFSIPERKAGNQKQVEKSSIILACYSKRYFSDKLLKAGSYSLLTTNGLMAPEAYTLEAALSSWFSGKPPSETHAAASAAYSKYQKANLSWAKRLFSTAEQ